MFSKEVFGERIKMLRKEKNIKQSKLGEAVGLTYTAISDIERARRTTTLDKLYDIAEYFDVSIDYLMGRTDNREVNK